MTFSGNDYDYKKGLLFTAIYFEQFKQEVTTISYLKMWLQSFEDVVITLWHHPHVFSFRRCIDILRMSFICAPYIKEVWGDAEVDGKIVAARQGNQLVTAFHPELNDSLEIHKYFLGMCKK